MLTPKKETSSSMHNILNAGVLYLYTPVMMADTKESPQSQVLEQELVETPWRVILYDDDIHTFDEVIEQLIKATGCSLTRAEELTKQVHNEGKAIVYEGDFVDCLQVDGVLKEIQLVTEIRG